MTKLFVLRALPEQAFIAKPWWSFMFELAEVL